MEEEEEISVEAECKNCNHAISVHKPSCTAIYRDFTKEHICGCKKPQYYGAIISNKYIGWTEFHCNNCGKLIGFLNSLDESIYEIAQDEATLYTNCIATRK
jgi:hypothetical protein